MNGMALEREDRGNPFKLGFIGSSDNHNSSGSYEEDNYFGTTPLTGIPEVRASIPLLMVCMVICEQYSLELRA